MAVIFIEGFDHYDPSASALTKGWDRNFSSFVSGQLGGQAVHFGASGGGQGFRFMKSSTTELWSGFRYANTVPNIGTHLQSVWFRSGATNTVRIGINSVGQLFFANSGGSQIGALGTTIINPSQWYYVEVHILCAGASGSVEMRINGTTEIAAATVNIGSTAIDNVGFGFNNGQATRMDDWYVVNAVAPNNSWLGDSRVEAIYPTAEGASSGWTPSSGTDNALMVDDPATIDSDSTYVQTATGGTKDTHIHGDLSTASGGVFAVQSCITARKTDSNVASVRPVTRPSGTDFAGTAVAKSTSYATGLEIADTNPATGLAWTIADVNAAEFGYEYVP